MTPRFRLSLAFLAALLAAQAVGKLRDMSLYAMALDRFRAFPPRVSPAVAATWVLVEVVAASALGFTAATDAGLLTLGILGAAAALLDALAYAVLTLGTYVRGIEVLNCTCFGAFLPQRLSLFVLTQDVGMLAWTAWTLAALVRLRAPSV